MKSKGKFSWKVAFGCLVLGSQLIEAGSPVDFSTYLGGSGTDVGWDVAIDGDDAPALVGFTDSFDLFAGLGVERDPNGFGNDGFATRFDRDGRLLFGVYLGGTAEDKALAARFLGDDLVVVGPTASADFPVTDDAFQPVYGGGAYDAFLVRLSPLGEIVYATFLGGSGEDSSCSLAVDGDIVTVCGYTESNDFPVTPDAYQRSQHGLSDIFITRLDLSRKGKDQLLYSTYFGGSRNEVGQEAWPGNALKETTPKIALSPDGSLVIAGRTESGDFPITLGAYQATKSTGGEPWDAYDAFIVKFDSVRGKLLYSTFLGGSNFNDSANGVAVEPDGTIVAVGHTLSAAFPTTAGAFQRTRPGGYNDTFVVRIVPDPRLLPENQLLYSTFLGGNGYDWGMAIVVDQPGIVTVLGESGSTNFPTIPGAWDTEGGASVDNGNSDLFLVRLKMDPSLPPAKQLQYATYFGGSRYDGAGNGLATGGHGGVFFSAHTESLDYPASIDAVQGANGGGTDAALTRFDLRIPEAIFTMTSTGLETVRMDGSASTTPAGTTIASYVWDFGDSGIADGVTADHTYAQPGFFMVQLTVTNDLGLSATTTKVVTISCQGTGDLSPWTDGDIGAPGFPGNAWRDGDCFSLCAGGKLLLGTSDQLHFIEKEFIGDFVLNLRIEAMDGSPLVAQMGLMARYDLDPRSAMASVGISKTTNSCTSRFNWRATLGGIGSIRVGGKTVLPAWLRLERKGNDFIGSSSTDGSIWTEVGRKTLMESPEKLLVGIFGIGQEPTDGSAFEPLEGRACLEGAQQVKFRRGDDDGSGTIDISDPIFHLTYLFLGGKAPDCLDAGDANDDGSLDLSDPVYILTFLFLAGDQPRSPYPDCGVEEWINTLDCRSYPGCH